VPSRDVETDPEEPQGHSRGGPLRPSWQPTWSWGIRLEVRSVNVTEPGEGILPAARTARHSARIAG